MIHFIILRMTRTIHYCNFCDYKSDRRYDRDKHVNKKHGIDPFAIIQTGSGTEPIKQTTPQGKYSNIQHHSIHQLYETIKHWQKASAPPVAFRPSQINNPPLFWAPPAYAPRSWDVYLAKQRSLPFLQQDDLEGLG